MDIQGLPVINYRYNRWLLMDTTSGSKRGSGMVVVLEDARYEGIVNKQGKDRRDFTIQATEQGPKQETIRTVNWNSNQIPKDFKKDKPNLPSRALPPPKGLIRARMIHLMKLVMSTIAFTGAKIWIPATEYDGTEGDWALWALLEPTEHKDVRPQNITNPESIELFEEVEHMYAAIFYLWIEKTTGD